MRQRRQTVEHPFGTIKHCMGSTHFLTKTLARVSTEMSLHVLAYDLKRVMQVLGITETMKAMRLAGVSAFYGHQAVTGGPQDHQKAVGASSDHCATSSTRKGYSCSRPE